MFLALTQQTGVTAKIAQDKLKVPRAGDCRVQENIKTQSYMLCIWYSSDIALVTLLRMSGDMEWS